MQHISKAELDVMSKDGAVEAMRAAEDLVREAMRIEREVSAEQGSLTTTVPNEMIRQLYTVFMLATSGVLGPDSSTAEQLPTLALRFYVRPSQNIIRRMGSDVFEQNRHIIYEGLSASPEDMAAQAELVEAWLSAYMTFNAAGALDDEQIRRLTCTSQMMAIAYNRVRRHDAAAAQEKPETETMH